MRCLLSLSLMMILASSSLACAAAQDENGEPAENTSAEQAFSRNKSVGKPAMTDVAQPDGFPPGFYPEQNVGSYYGPCGPVSAVYLMNIYVGRGPGGTGDNQRAFDRASVLAQGDRLLPGSSPAGLAYAINTMMGNGSLGRSARSESGASMARIRELLDENKPVIMLMGWQDPDATFVTMHYVTALGYRSQGDTRLILVHDNGAFREIEEAVLDNARNTPFHRNSIVWIGRAASVTLPRTP
jgi:hypothetical protein